MGKMRTRRRHRRKIGGIGKTDQILMDIVQLKHGSWIDGDVHFYDYLVTDPMADKKNIPYIRDIPAVQASMAKYKKSEIKELHDRYTDKLKGVDGFITMTDTFADRIKEYYGIDVPHGIFRNYPNWIPHPDIKRREIVYIDQSGSLPIGFYEHLKFLNDVQVITGIPTVFISKKFTKPAIVIRNKYKFKSRIRDIKRYDYGSEFGIMMDTRGFGQANESLARKLLIYLLCGMKVLIDPPWEECIKYMRSVNMEPLIYHDIKELDRNMMKFDFGSWREAHFQMKNRLADLKAELLVVEETTKETLVEVLSCQVNM